MSRGEFNNAYTSGQTVTSSRFFPRGQHKSLTLRISTSRAITWQAYSVHLQTQKRVALFTNADGTAAQARAVAAGNGDQATVDCSADGLEIDVANTDSTAGTYSWEFVENT